MIIIKNGVASKKEATPFFVFVSLLFLYQEFSYYSAV